MGVRNGVARHAADRNIDLVLDDRRCFSASPTTGWPPGGERECADAVEAAGRGWGAWAEDRKLGMPELLNREWAALQRYLDTPLEVLAEGESSPGRAADCERLGDRARGLVDEVDDRRRL